MKARARLFGHPLHQMLVVFPLGLLAAAVISDLASIAFDSALVALVALVSYVLIAGGLLGAAIAIPFGLADYTAIPSGTRAKRIGMLHGVGNSMVSVLFLISLMMREPGAMANAFALTCAFAGAAIALLTAWLGAEMIVRHGIGIDSDASITASSRGNNKVRPAAAVNNSLKTKSHDFKKKS